MTFGVTRALLAFVFLAALVVGSGCNSIFGFDHGTRSEGGLPCGDATGTKSAACDDGFLCMFKSCEKTCVADSECAIGARCLNLSGGPGLGACVPVGVNCDQGCPRNTACSIEGQCRALCAPPLGSACERDQECRAGFCFGTDVRHDPPPEGDGGGAAIDAAIEAEAPNSDATADTAADTAPE